jgi:hypothetical protein
LPFVDNDIRNEWLAAVSAAGASVAASYDEAIHALASTRDVRFDIPDDLGPRWRPEEHPVSAATPTIPLPAGPLPTSPLPTVPAAAPQSIPEASQQRSADEPEAIPPQPATPFGDAAGLSTGAGGLGGMTGGIGGVVGSIVDGIGSLLGSLAGGSSDNSGIDPLELDDDNDDPVLDDVDKPDEGKDATEPASLDDCDVPQAPTVESPSATTEAATEPLAQAVGPPPPDAPAPADPPPPAATVDGSTPCEIAEDQLPQAGQ